MSEAFSLSLEQDAHDATTESSILALDLEEARVEFGVLFSHAHDAEVTGGFKDEAIAIAYGDLVMVAQPGIEAELMRRDGTRWVSVRTGEDAATVARARWGATT